MLLLKIFNAWIHVKPWKDLRSTTERKLFINPPIGLQDWNINKNYNGPKHPDIPENEYDDYNTVYDEGADLEEEENHELIEKNEIDEMMADET